MKLNGKIMGFKTENEKVGIVLDLLKDDTIEQEIHKCVLHTAVPLFFKIRLKTAGNVLQ